MNHRLDVAVYERRYSLLICDELDKVCDFINSVHFREKDDQFFLKPNDIEDMAAGVFGSGNDHPVIWFPFLPDSVFHVKIVAHEIFHLTHMIMDQIGCPLSQEAREPWAYLTGFLTKQIYEKMAPEMKP